MSRFVNRMIRAAKLDPNLYEEVEADLRALPQALSVVVLASIAAGIGGLTQVSVPGMLVDVIAALAGWVIWAYLTFFIGTRLLPEVQTHADHGELLRTIGFSSSPGILRIFGVIPGLYGPVNLITSIWMLSAMIVAVRQALDYHSTMRAFGVCIIGWLAQVAIYMGLNMLF